MMLAKYREMVQSILAMQQSAHMPAGSQSLTRHFRWRYHRFDIARPVALKGIAAGLAFPILTAPCVGSPCSCAAIIGGHYGWGQQYLVFAPQRDGYAIALYLGANYRRLTDYEGRHLRGPRPRNPVIMFGYFAGNDN